MPRPPPTPSTSPHSVSLKVLRLSRPALTPHTPLPPTHFENGLDIHPSASPAGGSSPSFPLTPLLALPPTFGPAYVGETFACTLCAGTDAPQGRSVAGVSVVALLQTPSQREGMPLELEAAPAGDERGEDEVVQRIVRRELTDEGPHVLAVTVTYAETLRGGDGAARERTFRKLYQFVARQVVAVRSKVTELKRAAERGGRRRWVLEAQLENLGDAAVVVEDVRLGGREGMGSVGLVPEGVERLVLKPGDVEQVAFVVEELEKPDEATLGERVPLGQLRVRWRNAMGDPGSLTTGWLSSRRR